jgi:hydroxypyruvate isomerase
MPKFAANLTMLFNEVPFMDRFDAAAKAGFKAVEFLFPYAFDIDRIADRLGANDLQVVLHNLPAGNWDGGERGIACHPDRVGEFQDGVGKAIDAAKKLGARQLNCMAGKAPEGVAADLVRSTFIANLQFAAGKLQAEGIRLVTEPINTCDIPGFYLNRTQQAIDIIRDTGSDNLFLQYDIYHMQRMEGELANTIKAKLPLIKHMQLADNPGRFEPGTGEINYKFLFRFIDDIGYDGWIGLEYKPKTTTLEGLSWIAAHSA